MASDAGTIGFSDTEIERLRTYLMKGGFFWVDDYWGTAAWNQFESQIAKVLPPAEYPIEDVTLDDPMMHSVYSLNHVPQISNVQSSPATAERPSTAWTATWYTCASFATPAAGDGVMTHNTDIADLGARGRAWTTSQFSPDGYALGVDVLSAAALTWLYLGLGL
jgi:hypothetical protein